jgi:AcrR family transcriptional regulator
LPENLADSLQLSRTAIASEYAFVPRPSIATQEPDSNREPSRVRNRPAREQALIAAATRLFATKGYDATTTREIAAEAGCAEGLIHRYFQGKEGLLFAIIRSRTSGDTLDTITKPASSLREEFMHLVESELERMWQDREFFRVLMPRAFLDANLGHVLNRVGPLRRGNKIRERLRTACNGNAVSDHEVEALTQFIGSIGFLFGFLRPVVLCEDRTRARAVALATAEIFARSF